MSVREEIAPGVVRGEFHTVLPDGRVRCDVCPRFCTLHDGQRAFCFVRQAQGKDVVLTSYGRSTGFCVDPIEKKPLNHFHPGTAVLSFGTAGCNLGCRFCQNWDTTKAREVELMSSRAYPEDIAAAAIRTGSRSVAYTYNDPTIFLEYAVDTAEACRAKGVFNVAVTAGYIAEKARERFYGPMDAANIDLKSFSEQFYKKLCFAELGPILDTLKYVKHETKVWLEVTTLLIPGHNDSDKELHQLVHWFVDQLGPEVPLHFSAFHPDFKMLDVPATPPETLRHARQIAKAAGLQHVYTGNVHDEDGQSTYCHHCGTRLIERDWYELGEWNLDAEGRCRTCKTPLAGHFDARPGTWGGRRLPVSMARAPATL